MNHLNALLSLSFLSILLGCQKNVPVEQDEPKNLFTHDITSGSTPWTSDQFEQTEDDFTFAIVSDLTGGERPDVYSTAVAQLNRLDPTFVLSVGDLIDGGTEDKTQLRKEWDWFDLRTSSLNMPFFHLGGNHDLTNPVMREIWNERYGPRYYHFVYNDVLFLMLDSEDYEEKRMIEIYNARAEAIKILDGEVEGVYEETEYYSMIESKVGGMSQAQVDYYERVLADYPKVKWTFILMHKPLWLREDDKGLKKLENLLATRPYSVINGHFHSFSHQIRNKNSYTMLGTTGGWNNPADSNAFDHITLIRMTSKPIITHLKMEGILDETGKVNIVSDSSLVTR